MRDEDVLKAGCGLALFVAVPLAARAMFGWPGLLIAAAAVAYCLYLAWDEGRE